MKIFSIENRVINAIKRVPAMASNDQLLYIEVIYQIKPELVNSNFMDVFTNPKKNGVPSFAGVERARRKVQERYPELRINKKVRKSRCEKQKDYKDYGANNINFEV
ncbi:MAG: hypothetical protein RR662_05295 [Clostridia bacterium]